MIFSRVWAMPSADTFSIKPINDLIKRYRWQGKKIVDPFARNSHFTEWSNDINPQTAATYHMDCVSFLDKMLADGMRFDMALLDPPYSPSQVKECYQSVGREVKLYDTQMSPMFNEVKDRVDKLLVDDGIVITFGWNSSGMCVKRPYSIVEILLVTHGRKHNDTIVTVSRKRGLTIG
jgi:hypothetical protein